MESGKTGTCSLSWSPGCGRHMCAVPYFNFDLVTCVYYLWSADVGAAGVVKYLRMLCASVLLCDRGLSEFNFSTMHVSM